MAKNDFQNGEWNSYTLQCGTITTLILSGDCTLQCGMWLWNRDSEFTKWQHPAMWYVALGWHAIEFAQTYAILEFYFWFPFPHITACSRHVITSLRNFIQIGSQSAEKMMSCRFSRCNCRPVTRGGSGGSYEPPHEITRSGFLICIKLLIQIIT